MDVTKETPASIPDHSLPSLPNNYILKIGHSVFWDVGQSGIKEASTTTGRKLASSDHEMCTVPSLHGQLLLHLSFTHGTATLVPLFSTTV